MRAKPSRLQFKIFQKSNGEIEPEVVELIESEKLEEVNFGIGLLRQFNLQSSRLLAALLLKLAQTSNSSAQWNIMDRIAEVSKGLENSGVQIVEFLKQRPSNSRMRLLFSEMLSKIAEKEKDQGRRRLYLNFFYDVVEHDKPSWMHFHYFGAIVKIEGRTARLTEVANAFIDRIETSGPPYLRERIESIRDGASD